MAKDKIPKLTHKQAMELMHSPGVVAKLTEIAEYYADAANDMMRAVDGTEKSGGFLSRLRNQPARTEHFKVTVQNDPKSSRARAFVRPVGRTGIRIDDGQSVMLKSVPAVLGQFPGTNFKGGTLTAIVDDSTASE